MSEESKIDKSIKELRADLEANENVLFNDDGTVTLKLVKAVEYGDKLFENLTFRQATGQDWMLTDDKEGMMAKSFCLASAVSGVPFPVFLRMSGGDALTSVAIANFLGK